MHRCLVRVACLGSRQGGSPSAGLPPENLRLQLVDQALTSSSNYVILTV
jgi:hypothetical protein